MRLIKTIAFRGDNLGCLFSRCKSIRDEKKIQQVGVNLGGHP